MNTYSMDCEKWVCRSELTQPKYVGKSGYRIGYEFRLWVRFDRQGLSRFPSGIRGRADETGRNVSLQPQTHRR
jgi:hypothetical protein